MKPGVMTGESGRLQWDKAPKTAVETHAEGKLAACLDLENSEEYKPLYVLTKSGVPTGVKLSSLLESPCEETELTEKLQVQETETEVFNLEVKSSASWWGRVRSKFKTNSSRPKDTREQGLYLVLKNSRMESLEEEIVRKYLAGKTVSVESAGVHDLNGEFLVVSVAWTAEDVRAVVKTQENTTTASSSDDKNDEETTASTETEQVIETYSTAPCTVAFGCVTVKYNKDTGCVLASGSPRGTHKTKKGDLNPKESATSPKKSTSFRDRFKRRGSSISVEWSDDLEKKGQGTKLRSSGSWVDESELETIEG